MSDNNIDTFSAVRTQVIIRVSCTKCDFFSGNVVFFSNMVSNSSGNWVEHRVTGKITFNIVESVTCERVAPINIVGKAVNISTDAERNDKLIPENLL
jgi:hypothetical protein